jgi:glutathione S-transferase
LLLYNSQASGNCYKVRLVLGQLGIPFERQEVDVVDRSSRAELLSDKNPALRVPVLRLDDGRYLAESNAILWYLANGTKYLPEDEFARAQVLQWLFFEQYSHEPNIAVARYWITILRQEERYREQIARRHELGYLALDGMEAHLAGREYFVGGTYSIADIALYAYTHVAPEGGFELERYPMIRAWLDRVACQPGHITIDA